jgi:osmotically-inducible protein OsmY
VTHRTDTDLKTSVIEELDWTPGVDSTHVGVAVNRGAVTLSGEVETFPAKRIARHAVLGLRGVTAVADEITVRGGWQGVNDTDIAREATEALERCVSLTPGAITAQVHDHVITLEGQVPWHFQRADAARSVSYLKGVTDVVNHISVRPTVSPSDIGAAITAALVRTAQAEGRTATVTADENGAVTLEGTVHSWTERQAATRAAWSAPGVTEVIDNLHIQN